MTWLTTVDFWISSGGDITLKVACVVCVQVPGDRSSSPTSREGCGRPYPSPTACRTTSPVRRKGRIFDKLPIRQPRSAKNMGDGALTPRKATTGRMACRVSGKWSGGQVVLSKLDTYIRGSNTMANLAYPSKLLGHWNKMHDNNLKMEKRRKVQDASSIPRSQRPALNHATHVYQSRNPFSISFPLQLGAFSQGQESCAILPDPDRTATHKCEPANQGAGQNGRLTSPPPRMNALSDQGTGLRWRVSTDQMSFGDKCMSVDRCG
jgi:hypothetical protein